MKAQRCLFESGSLQSQAQVISILGPTGSGKTKHALELADQLVAKGNQVILCSVDVAAQYQHLNIGSAKPVGDERRHPWIGLDTLAPSQETTLKQYVASVEQQVWDAYNQKMFVILVGGTHFYERGLVDGLSPGEASDASFIESLQDYSDQQLHDMINKIDPVFGERLHLNDRYRLERAADLVVRQGLRFSDIASYRVGGLINRGVSVHTIFWGVEIPRPELEERLQGRLMRMVDLGWFHEVREVMNLWGAHCPALDVMGYKQIRDAITLDLSLEHVLPIILQEHLWLAKKQRTWARGLGTKLKLQSERP